MAKMIFVNLPVADVEKSVAFYKARGFEHTRSLLIGVASFALTIVALLGHAWTAGGATFA